ncbi:hypothetical protein CsSME_00046996 [Camellia sinensis var. sinensis]
MAAGGDRRAEAGRRSRRSRRPDEDEADELRDEDEADEDDPDEDEDDRGWLEEIDLADDPTSSIVSVSTTIQI